MSGLETRSNYEIFEESLSGSLVKATLMKELRQSKATRKEIAKNGGEIDAQNEANELHDFISYLSEELWPSLPEDVQTTSYEKKLADTTGVTGTIESTGTIVDNLPRTFVDSILDAQILEDERESHEVYMIPNCESWANTVMVRVRGSIDDVKRVVTNVLEDYLQAACAPPKKWNEVRPDNCELCGRNVFLSYHHLIPRSTHARVRKKNIHPEHMLNRVAYICRPCHGFVHSIEDNMELARNWYTIEKLETREDVQKWVAYNSKQQWRTMRKV